MPRKLSKKLSKKCVKKQVRITKKGGAKLNKLNKLNKSVKRGRPAKKSKKTMKGGDAIEYIPGTKAYKERKRREKVRRAQLKEAAERVRKERELEQKITNVNNNAALNPLGKPTFKSFGYPNSNELTELEERLKAAKNEILGGPNFKGESSCPTREMCKRCYSEETGLNLMPKAVALYDYSKYYEDDVSLTNGEEVEILEERDGGWTKVKKVDGKEGLVPTDFIKVIEPVALAASAASAA